MEQKLQRFYGGHKGRLHGTKRCVKQIRNGGVAPLEPPFFKVAKPMFRIIHFSPSRLIVNGQTRYARISTFRGLSNAETSSVRAFVVWENQFFKVPGYQ